MAAVAPLTEPLPRTGLRALDYAELALLGAIWGASFLFMRVAAPELGAPALVEVRLALGALVLSPLLWPVFRRIDRGLWGKLALIGALNSAIPFLLFAWAASRAPAGIGAIANSLTVPFTALVALVACGEAIGIKRGIGLAAGFVGVIVLASGKTAGVDVTWPALAGALAAACYAVAAVMVRKHVAALPPTAVAAATLSCATLLVMPFAIAQWPAQPISLPALGSALAIGVLCTGVAYALYFRLIRRLGPARAATVTYLVPLFGVAWAWLVLGEPLTVPMAIAGALILGGVALSQSRSATR